MGQLRFRAIVRMASGLAERLLRPGQPRRAEVRHSSAPFSSLPWSLSATFRRRPHVAGSTPGSSRPTDLHAAPKGNPIPVFAVIKGRNWLVHECRQTRPMIFLIGEAPFWSLSVRACSRTNFPYVFRTLEVPGNGSHGQEYEDRLSVSAPNCRSTASHTGQQFRQAAVLTAGVAQRVEPGWSAFGTRTASNTTAQSAQPTTPLTQMVLPFSLCWAPIQTLAASRIRMRT